MSAVTYADNGGAFLRVRPDGVGSGDFLVTSGEAANSDGDRKNQTLLFGYNIVNGGQQELAGEAGLALSFQNYYRLSAATIDSILSLLFVAPGGAQSTPVACSVNQVDGVTQWEFRATQVRFASLANATVAYVLETAVQFGEPGSTIPLRVGTNDTAAVQQLNAAGAAFVDIVKVDGANRVVVDPGGMGAKHGGAAGFSGATPVQGTRPGQLTDNTTGAAGNDLVNVDIVVGLNTLADGPKTNDNVARLADRINKLEAFFVVRGDIA
jgi:hypothetical protein